MPRIAPLDSALADPRAASLLDAVRRKLGVVPNMMRTMAQSPAVLDGYLALSDALALSSLGSRIGEQIALLTAEENGCAYCAAAHSALGRGTGLTDAELEYAREGRGANQREDAALALARAVIRKRGHVADADLMTACEAGLSDGEVAEIVAHVALNTFTNYFNVLAGTEVDFPEVRVPRGPFPTADWMAVSA